MPERSFQPLEDPADAPDSLDFKKVVSTLLERIWLIVACLVICGVASVVYLNLAPHIYEAITILKLDPNQPKLLDMPGIIQEDFRGPSLEPKLKEIKQTLLSRPVLLRVVKTNNLARDSRFVSPESVSPGDDIRLARQLERMIEVTIPKDNSLVAVMVEHENPELATQLANSLANELIRHSSKSKEEIINMVEAKLSEMLQTLRQEWKQYETSLQPYRNESASLGRREADMGKSLIDLNQKLIEVMLQRIRLEAEEAQVEKLGTNAEALLKLPLVASDPTVAAVRASIVLKEAAFANLKQRYKEKHPKYIEAENELAALQGALVNDAIAAAQNIKVSIESAMATERALRKEFDEQKAAAQELSQKLIQSTNNVLVREIELHRTIHDKVMQRLKEATMTSGFFYNPIGVFQVAEVPLKPSKPEKVKVLMVGVVGGLVAGVALALALGFVDTSLKSLEETEQFLDLPVLTTIPRVHSLDPTGSQMVMNNEGTSAGAESFRSLRTSISVLGRNRELRSILFTSALPEEGKSLCAVNYAVSLAQQGLKTVLIECDLRRPQAHQSFSGLKEDAPGLTDYLKWQPIETDTRPAQRSARGDRDLSFAELRTKQRGEPVVPFENRPANLPASPAGPGQIEVNQIVQKTDTENLFLISAGTVKSNSSELLARQGMNYLIADVLRRYDRVVIDSAPIFGVSDTLLLANRVHGVCLVIRANRTPRKAVMRAVEMLRRVDARLAGVVLNGMVSSRMSGYNDPYYDYGYVSKKADQDA